MTTHLSNAERIRKLPWLLSAETLSMFFVLLTFSGSIFIFFLDELGLDTAEIGFLLALIPMAGIIAPFIAPAVARFGYKRTYVTFWAIRKFVMALMLLTPLIFARYGSQGAFLWVSAIILIFALCRATAETGGYPWKKEAVPDSIRGKYTAINNMSITVASILVTVVAGFVIETYDGLAPFMGLMAVGIGFGLISIIAYAQVPGEDPANRQPAGSKHFQEMGHTLKDRNFALFLVVLGLVTIGVTAVNSFVPLYMKDIIGLSEGLVILLSVGTYIGALLTSLLWGWAADRYGSKPVMQLSLVLILILPVSWSLLPANSPASAPLAMAVSVVAGIATLAWGISWTRYLFVNAIPSENKAVYLAVYYAWLAIVGGLGPILAGQILALSEGVSGQIGILTINPFTPLFLMSVILVIVSMVAVSRLQTEGKDSFRQFAGMFLRGNPIKALRLLVQYNLSGDEMTRIVAAEQMGDAQSPLSTLELIEAIHDPSFNVRLEAIHSAGRMPPDPELRDALISVLENPEAELNISAARALGRMGDEAAIPALRQSLEHHYRPLAANSARALALLGDQESGFRFLEKLQEEPNPRLRLAYVSALGHLQVTDSLEVLLDLFHHAQSPVTRGEIGLAIARICGDEKYYLQHWRSLRSDFATATAQAILDLEKEAKRCNLTQFESLILTAARQFGEGDNDAGTDTLQEMISKLPLDALHTTLITVLDGCSWGLGKISAASFEYTLLSLATINAAFQQMSCD